MILLSEDEKLKKGFKYLYKKYGFDKIKITIKTKIQERQGYSITKEKNIYTISYSEPCFFFNALGLLASNNKCFSRSEYSIKIGLLVDCSRNAVPTICFLKDYITDLLLIGYDYFGLYLEDLIEVPDEPYLGWKRGRYSASEITEIVNFADDFGVEIFPCLETISHMNAMFRCPFWSYYNEIHDMYDSLLVREPKTYVFLDKYIGAVAKLFKTKRVHIGMDELFVPGRGHFLDKYGYVNKYDLFYEHLEKVLDICDKYGLKPEVASDMIVCYDDNSEPERYIQKEERKKLLSRVKLSYWDYYSDSKEHYNEKIKRVKSITNNFSFWGAAWGYVGQTPLNQYGLNNLNPALQACKENKIQDVLITQWGDLCGEGSFYAVLPTMISAMDYFVDGGLSKTAKNNLSKFIFNYSFDELMKMDLPNSVKDDVRNNVSFCLMANDVLLDLMGLMACYDYEEKYKAIAKTLKDLSNKKSKINYVFHALYVLADCLSLKSVITLKLKDAYHKKDKATLLKLVKTELPSVIKKLFKYRKEMQKQWLKEKKSFGLDLINMRISGTICQCEYAIDMFNKYIEGQIDKIEEYEEEDLKYFSFWGDENYRQQNLVVYTDWYNMVSNSRLHYSNNPYATF